MNYLNKLWQRVLYCEGFISAHAIFYKIGMHLLSKLFIQYLLCDTEPAKIKHKRCGHGRGSMLSFLFKTVGNSLTGNSWDCLSNWFKCAFNLLFRSVSWLCKWAFYGRWWVQVFFYFPWVLIWYNDDKKIFTREIAAVFKTTILLWWTALLDSWIYTEQEELGKIFRCCKTQEKKGNVFDTDKI